MLRIDGKPIFTIDLMSEHFLFAHRITLGKLAETGNDVEVVEGIMRELYGVRIKPKHYAGVFPHIQEVLQALARWIEKEKQLAYTPTAEEKQAGLSQISEKLKEFATIDAIATRTGLTHDQVLQLPYSTVFMMLLADLEKSKFEKRLMKVYERKRK